MSKEPLNPSIIDKRVVDRNVKKGLVTREAYDKYLHALPDVADLSEKIQARLGAEDEIEDDEDEAEGADGEESDSTES